MREIVSPRTRTRMIFADSSKTKMFRKKGFLRLKKKSKLLEYYNASNSLPHNSSPLIPLPSLQPPTQTQPLEIPLKPKTQRDPFPPLPTPKRRPTSQRHIPRRNCRDGRHRPTRIRRPRRMQFPRPSRLKKKTAPESA